MRTPARKGHFAVLAGLSFAMLGCTSMSGLSGSSSYACKAPEGVTCDSVSGTYANAAQNNLPSQRQRRSGPGSPERSGPPRLSMAVGTPMVAEGLSPSPVALRSSPRILRLWFKPWEDADHDLYDQGYIYVQIDAGQWQLEHVQRQIRDAYAPLKAPPGAASLDRKNANALPPNLKSAARLPGETFPGLQSPAAPRREDTPE